MPVRAGVARVAALRGRGPVIGTRSARRAGNGRDVGPGR